MTPEQFCYWMQGALEVSGCEEFSKEQVAVIREHLDLVFNKKTEKVVTPPAAVKPGIPIRPTSQHYCGPGAVRVC